MKTLLLTAFLCAFAAVVSAQPLTAIKAVSADDGLATHLALSAYLVSGFVDLATTEYGIGRGVVREANPIFAPAVNRGPVTAGLVKGSVHTAIAWMLLRRHESQPKMTFWLSLIAASAQVAVDVHNARTIQGVR